MEAALMEPTSAESLLTGYKALCPKTIEENLEYRAKLLERAKEDPSLQPDLMELCARDILFWFNAFAWTYDPREKCPHLPFVTYDFQDEYILGIWTDIQKGEDSITEKTRDMGASWMVLGVFVYAWRFHGMQFLVGSRKEELVDTLGDMDSLFERMRYMIRRMPFWMHPDGFDAQTNMCSRNISNPEDSNSISGEATNKSFARQGRYNAILLDEFAFVDNADSIWQSASESTPCRLAVSTPKGKHNKFAQLKKMIKVYTLHWSKHPKKTAEWYESQKVRKTPREMAEELDINYLASAGKPFYDGYRVNIHRRSGLRENWNRDMIMIRGWDYGFHHPACVFLQRDAKDRVPILHEMLGSDVTIDRFADQVIAVSNSFFPGAQWIDFGDPAGNQKSDKSEKTSVEILFSKGIRVSSIASEYRLRKELIESKLRTYVEDLPQLLVDERCTIIDEAFQGGYHFPEVKDGKAEKEEPEKDGYYDHLMNAVEYAFVNLFSVRRPNSTLKNFDHMFGGGRGGY